MTDTDDYPDTEPGFALLGWPCRYTIMGTLSRMREDGWESRQQIPTFHLDTVIHGIVSEDHAERIARDMLTTIDGTGGATFHLAVAASFERLT